MKKRELRCSLYGIIIIIEILLYFRYLIKSETELSLQDFKIKCQKSIQL